MSAADLQAHWLRAQRMQAQAAELGFDWPDIAGVFDKLREEIAEVRDSATHDQRNEEMGDVLFVLAHLARRLDIDAVAALDQACAKFERRFAHVMAAPEALPPLGHPDRMQAMEVRWQRAKQTIG